VACALLAVVAAPQAAQAAELPLGSRALDERRSVARVAPGISWMRIVREGGPWRVNVLRIRPDRLAGRVGGVLSNRRVAGRERTSAMGRRTRALAGVNGGFFAVDGDPVGALAIGGRLLSEPVDGRSGLLVPSVTGAPPSIAPLEFEGEVAGEGEVRSLDGIERRRGVIPACGGRGGDRPTERPNAALTCTDPSELVLLSRRYGPATATRGGLEAVLDRGVVSALQRGGSTAISRGRLILSASGAATGFLRRAAPPGSRPELRIGLEAEGQDVDLDQHALVVGGGPRLLAEGRVAVAARAEGFAPLEAPGFFSSFVRARNPRTLAGVRRDGSLLLVTVDGRQPGWSAGATLGEAARLMRALGARDALNLDGGGSTAMTVRGELVNRPSDPAGERSVSDGVFVLP
jgi:Phosphodiester glycosidase